MPLHSRASAKRTPLEFGPFLSLCFAKFGGSDREDAVLRLRAEEIVEAKPEKSQARNAGDANKAQGEASAVCERNPGSRKGIASPRSGRSTPPDFDHPLRGFRSFNLDTQASATRLAALRRSASPWASFGPPAPRVRASQRTIRTLPLVKPWHENQALVSTSGFTRILVSAH